MEGAVEASKMIDEQRAGIRMANINHEFKLLLKTPFIACLGTV